MKLFLIILFLLLNCIDNKVENNLSPLLSYIVSFRLYPISSLNSVNLNSSNLPGTPRAVIRANGTTYGLIENDSNSNILTLYQSSDGINFSSTGHSFDSTSITGGNKNNLIFISNTLHYVSSAFSILNFSPYSYLTYTSNNGWSAINTLNYTNAPNSSSQLNCIYYFNNTLYLSLESKIMSLDISNGNLTDLNSSPGYSGPRGGSNCFVTNSSVYLSGGYRTSGGSSTSFTDFYKSDDGLTFIKKTSALPLNSTSSSGIQLNNGKLILCSFACTTSSDNGENWTVSVSINVNNTFVSNINIISNITDGESIYLYSSSGKVFYGKL
jgi:hypothetical protein